MFYIYAFVFVKCSQACVRQKSAMEMKICIMMMMVMKSIIIDIVRSI